MRNNRDLLGNLVKKMFSVSNRVTFDERVI